MKFPIGLFFAAMCFSSAFGSLTKRAFETLQDNQKHCVELSGISLESLKTILRDKKIYEDEVQENFAVCMLKRANIMNAEGSITELARNYLLLTDDPSSYQTAVQCVSLAGANVRETARKIMTCHLQIGDMIVLDRRPLKA